MRSSTRLAMALHAILHIAEEETPITSAALAERMRADASVIRRTLSGLREHGYISSDKGHGGGWTLSCDLNEVSLCDVYEAVGSPSIFTFGGTKENESECLVERAVNKAICDAINEAEKLLLENFSNCNLAQLSEEFTRGYRSSHPIKHQREA